jgi:fructokinase
MITVVGEALVDLVIQPDGTVEAKLGGAPFNTARACGRLGAHVRFVGAISVDRFGTMLADQLVADGVDTSAVARVAAPTTLAAAELDGAGAATYRFYICGTSAPMLAAVPAVAPGESVFAGGLGLVLEPMAGVVEAALHERAAGTLAMVDVNCRPSIVVDRDDYLARVGRVVSGADIVKVSDDDLAYISPGTSPLDAARSMLGLGASAVLLTRGGDGAHVLTSGRETLVPVDVVDVVDTIGAGDSFGAGFLSWWVASGLGPDDAGDHRSLVDAVRAATRVAGIVVGRRGADPPWRSELPPDWSP